LVLDDRVVATMRAQDDTVAWSKAWQALDVSTIKRIDILATPEAVQQYPTAVGGVIKITRCYQTDIATHRPNRR
jgi:outer membrane cobalamin receptor